MIIATGNQLTAKRLASQVVACILILCGFSSHAQFQNILIDQFANETAIAIDPLHPERMVAGANVDNYYFSTDSGLTWNASHLSGTWGNAGDPNVVTDSLGSFFYFHLVPAIDQIVSQKTSTFPPSWNGGSAMGQQVPKLQDHDWAYADWTNHYLYCTWTQYDNYPPVSPTDSTHILLCASYDHGQTWTTTKRLDETGGDCNYLDVIEPRPYSDNSGNVYVTWEDGSGIWMDKSSDTGSTWLAHDQFVTNVPGGVYYSVPGIDRVRCTPFIGIDRSNGPHRGTIYVNWSDQRNGMNNSDIWIISSTDSGQTWTAPLRVNDDVTVTHQFLNAMAIDPVSGNIYVTFFDRRNYADDSTDVYLAYSNDGGATFTNLKISAQGFMPNDVFVGDYISIAAYNGIVRPCWTSVNSFNVSEVYTAIINGNILTGIPSPATFIDQTFSVQPNRVFQNATVKFFMAESGNAEISVFDLPGKKQQTVFEGFLPAGEQSLDLHAENLLPGMYICRLATSRAEKTAKFVVAK